MLMVPIANIENFQICFVSILLPHISKGGALSTYLSRSSINFNSFPFHKATLKISEKFASSAGVMPMPVGEL